MSEQLRPEDHEAIIIPFKDHTDYLDDLGDDEVLSHFLSELRHPGVRGRLPQYILEYAGTKRRDNLTPERIAWRERMERIRFSVGVSNHDWDRLIDETDEEYDAGFAAIVHALQDTRENKELAEERQALLVLLDLRVAAINRGLVDTDEWQELVNRLIRRA